MSNRNSELKESVQRELAALAKARDELKVQMHLAKAEVRDEWSKLETSFSRLQDDLKRTSEEIKQPVRELSGAAHNLLEELKRGYERVRASLRQTH